MFYFFHDLMFFFTLRFTNSFKILWKVVKVRIKEVKLNAHMIKVVRGARLFLESVMAEDFWLQGVVFRRFRGQVPQERSVT